MIISLSEVTNMKKALPLTITGVALLTIAGCLGYAFRNNIKPQTVKAQEYQIEFTANDIVDELSEMDGTESAYVYFEKETPKGNIFGLNDLGTIYGANGVSYKQNGKMVTISDAHGYGYFSFLFKFNLSMATFDHITCLGTFTTGYSNPTTTSYVTFDTLDDATNGYVTCYLGAIVSAEITQINVVYHC